MAASMASLMPRESPPGWKLSGLSLLRWMLRTPAASRPDTLACNHHSSFFIPLVFGN